MSKTKRRLGEIHQLKEYVSYKKPTGESWLRGRVRNRPAASIPSAEREEILTAKFHSDAGPHLANQSLQRRSVRKLRQLGRAFVKAVTRNPELADSKVAPAKKESRVVGL